MPGRLFLERDAGVGADVPRHNIAPGQDVNVLTADGPRRMRWGMIPVGRVNARGRPVMETIINARSETVFDKTAFEGVRRAVVPVEGWYEWTGAGRRKTAWRITRKDRELIWFAAIYDVWTAPGGMQVPQVAIVTCTPSADVRDIHHRMGVIVNNEDIPRWLADDEAAAQSVAVPFSDGMLKVCQVTDVDWSGV